MARIRAARVRGRRARLLGGGHGTPAGGAAGVADAAADACRGGLVRRGTDRLAPRTRGDERARLRSPRAAPLGARPRLLRDDLRGGERRAGARGPGDPRLDRPLDVRLSALRDRRRGTRREDRRHPGAARAGAREPRWLERARPLAGRGAGLPGAGEGPRRLRGPGGGDERRSRPGHRRRARRLGGVHRLAGGGGTLAHGPLRDRPGELHLVHAERAPRPLLVGGAGDDHAA